MAKVLTKDDVAAACEKAAAKATAAERKRCIAAVKAANDDGSIYDASMQSKDFVRGAKQGLTGAIRAIKDAAE